jgi:fatty acid desaturase
MASNADTPSPAQVRAGRELFRFMHGNGGMFGLIVFVGVLLTPMRRGGGRMTSWIVWAVTVAVAGLIGYTAAHFGVRTLRYVTLAAAVVLLVAVTAYGLTPADGKAPPDQ